MGVRMVFILTKTRSCAQFVHKIPNNHNHLMRFFPIQSIDNHIPDRLASSSLPSNFQKTVLTSLNPSSIVGTSYADRKDMNAMFSSNVQGSYNYDQYRRMTVNVGLGVKEKKRVVRPTSLALALSERQNAR
jgi:hypothetical protein